MTFQDETIEHLAATIHSPAETLVQPSPVPKEPGVYGRWFRELPAGIDVQECISRDDLTLLYAGISPKGPPKNGRSPSKKALRSRIKNSPAQRFSPDSDCHTR